jgi:hypothetical protein
MGQGQAVTVGCGLLCVRSSWRRPQTQARRPGLARTGGQDFPDRLGKGAESRGGPGCHPSIHPSSSVPGLLQGTHRTSCPRPTG